MKTLEPMHIAFILQLVEGVDVFTAHRCANVVEIERLLQEDEKWKLMKLIRFYVLFFKLEKSLDYSQGQVNQTTHDNFLVNRCVINRLR